MAKLFPPAHVFHNNSGQVLSGGGVVFYDTGTTTLRNVFTDAALSSAATNSATTTPKGQPLDADGRFTQGDLYGSGTYTVVLFDSSGGTVQSRDDFNRDANPDDGLDTQMTINQTTDIITFKIDGTDAIKMGWQEVADTGMLTIDGKATSADATENTHRLAVLASNAITIPAGTTTLVSTGYFIEPNITNNGTITNASTVYIKDAPTEATNNYALWVAAGLVKFDGTMSVVGISTFSDKIVSDIDSTDDIGTTTVRWANLFVDDITVTTSITAGGVITGQTVEATGDTSSDDNAAMGYTSSEGLILTGQGSVTDVTIKNDADATVISIPTGTTNVDVVGVATAATFEPDGDTAANDAAAIGYTSSEGLILTGQGSVDDVTIKNDADVTIIKIATGQTTVNFTGDISAGNLIATTLAVDGDTAVGDAAKIGYTSAEGIIVTGQGSTYDVVIKNDADANVIQIPTGTTTVELPGVLSIDVTTDSSSGTTGSLHTDGGIGAVKDIFSDAAITSTGLLTGLAGLSISGTTASTIAIASGSAVALTINQDGSGTGILIDSESTSGAGIFISNELSTSACIEMNKTTKDAPFFNFLATADADTTSAISSHVNSGTTTHHIQVDINDAKAWIAVSTNVPTA